MLHLTNQPLLDIAPLEHNNVVMHNKAGQGGGDHILRDIWDSTVDSIDDQQYLAPAAQQMLAYFRGVMPDVVIRNYRLEHRIYIMDNVPFVGKMHDDSCEYSVVHYYRIDPDIRGGLLHFYDDDERALDVYTPKVGDTVVFTGLHSVGELSAVKPATRSIIICHINSED